MSFQGELRKSLKTKGQLRDEAAEAAEQEDTRIAAFNHEVLKRKILEKAQHAEAAHGKISGIFEIEYDRYEKAYVPYTDPFEVKEHENVSTVGFLSEKDIHHISFTVNNMARLDAVWAKMHAMAEADGIKLSEPFLYGTIYDVDKKCRKKEVRFERKFGKLSGKLQFTRSHGLHSRKFGESGSISIAVEYECRV